MLLHREFEVRGGGRTRIIGCDLHQVVGLCYLILTIGVFWKDGLGGASEVLAVMTSVDLLVEILELQCLPFVAILTTSTIA